MSPGVNYVDTCVAMMFTNRNDSLRIRYGLRLRKAEDCVARNHRRFLIPMPALGELVHMIRVRCHDERLTVISELDRLLENGFLNISFIGDPYAVYTMARDISRSVDDGRDQISPMDAFIMASAATDGNCDVLYSSDNKLQFNTRVSMMIDEWRKERGMDRLKVEDVSKLLRRSVLPGYREVE